MKRAFITFVIALMCIFSASAQEWGYRTGVDIKFGSQQLTNTADGTVYESADKFGASFSFTQIQFHKKPIGGYAFIGLDLGISGDFATYRTVIDNDYQRGGSLIEGLVSAAVLGKNGMMQLDLGVPVGPYVKVAPLAGKGNTDLRVSAYYHIIPSFSAIALDESYAFALKPFNAFGALVSWTCFSVGYEIRKGAADYRMATADEIQEGAEWKDLGVLNGFSTVTKSIILKLSF